MHLKVRNLSLLKYIVAAAALACSENEALVASSPAVQTLEEVTDFEKEGVATVGAIDISTEPVADLSNVPTEGICPGCDVVVISVCSLRRDYVGVYGETDVQTPNIDQLATQSMRFNQAYSTSSFTFASLSSVVTGRFGSATGVVRWGTGLSDQVKTLPEIMGYYGYATGAFSIDAASGFRPEYGIQRGFQRISVILPPRDTPDGRLRGGEPGPGGDSARGPGGDIALSDDDASSEARFIEGLGRPSSEPLRSSRSPR